MNNQLELSKWLKDQLQKTDIEFGEYSRNRTTLENSGVMDEDDKKFYSDNLNRLRFRYHWIEAQINELNKK
jgi:transposase